MWKAEKKALQSSFRATILLHLFMFPSSSPGADLDFQIENTNIIYHVHSLFDYNRLRLDSYLDLSPDLPLSATLIVDNITLYDRKESSFDNSIEVYRAFFEYQTENLSLTAGRQRIPLGVGRIWNPIDIFNPIDITSAEPEEREGTDALRVDYSPTSLSAIDLTLAEKKGAARIKAFVFDIDLAAVLVIDEDEDLYILGWELEGELLDTGIELRSEGGSFYDTHLEEQHFEYIAGAEYGFSFPLTVLGEYNYNGNNDTDSLALQFSSQINHLLSVSFLVLTSVEDQSLLYSPNILYSLSDEMTLNIGMFLTSGGEGELYSSESQIFVTWFVQF